MYFARKNRVGVITLLVIAVPLCLAPAVAAQTGTKTDVRTALQDLFSSPNTAYYIAPGVKGEVLVGNSKASVESRLRSILDQSNSQFRMTNNIFEVFPQSGPPPIDFFPNLESDVPLEEPAHAQLDAITQDERFLYLFRGSTVTKLLKADLTITRTGSLSPQSSSQSNRDDTGGSRLVKELSVNQVDVRLALQQVFEDLNVPYGIDPRIRGSVTLDVRNSGLEQTVRMIVRQVHYTYRITKGFFEVVPSVTYDDAKIIGQVHADNVDVRNALRQAFTGLDNFYSIDPEVKGTVTIDLHKVPLGYALHAILDQVGAAYRLEGGVHVIVPKGGIRYIRAISDPTPFALILNRAPHDRLTIQDNEFLYVLDADRVLKVRKSDLVLVASRFLTP